MTKLRATISALIICSLCFGAADDSRAGGEQTVSLRSLLSAAQKFHPTPTQHAPLKSSLALRQKQINQAYWPQLSLDAQATWQSEVTRIDIPVPSLDISPPAKDQYRATLNLRQTIWDGGVVSDRKELAAKSTGVEQESVNLEWYRVQAKILDLYMAGVVQQELRTQAEQLAQRLDPILKNVTLGLQQGVATERDVILVQAKQLEARQVVADADARLLGVRKGLAALTGVSLRTGVRLAPSSEACKTKASRVELATVKRPELSLLSAQAQLLDAQEELERAAERPKIAAFATGGYGRPGLNFLSNEFGPYFIGGLQLSIPLTYVYSGRRDHARRQLAQQRTLIARKQDAVKTQVQVQVETKQVELAHLDQAIARDRELLRLRERARKQTEIQLSLGTATMTDLVNDLSEEDRARSREAVHRAQRGLTCQQLAFIKGAL